MTPEQVTLVNDAVLNACDALDGVTDRLITDPTACRFDPGTLVCGERGRARGSACLTPSQADAVRIGYAPTVYSTGEDIFAGFARGSETGWTFLTGEDNRAADIADDTYRLAYDDPAWDWTGFNADRDLPIAMEQVGFIDATETDLSEFRDRGGKLILFHGWNDQLIPPGNTIDYYSDVLETMGPGQDDWLRLFMAPGMAHCRGGVGPDQIDFLSALERWRESGTAPDRITATRVTDSQVDMTRPLCPHPQIARWTGVGSTNDAQNFVCETP